MSGWAAPRVGLGSPTPVQTARVFSSGTPHDFTMPMLFFRLRADPAGPLTWPVAAVRR